MASLALELGKQWKVDHPVSSAKRKQMSSLLARAASQEVQLHGQSNAYGCAYESRLSASHHFQCFLAGLIGSSHLTHGMGSSAREDFRFPARMNTDCRTIVDCC